MVFKMRQPKVGDVVFFYPDESDVLSRVGLPCSAVVLGVSENGSLHLEVVHPSGISSHLRHSVPWRYDRSPGSGGWDWPEMAVPLDLAQPTGWIIMRERSEQTLKRGFNDYKWHPSREAAESEAMRLADKERADFVVLKVEARATIPPARLVRTEGCA